MSAARAGRGKQLPTFILRERRVWDQKPTSQSWGPLTGPLRPQHGEQRRKQEAFEWQEEAAAAAHASPGGVGRTAAPRLPLFVVVVVVVTLRLSSPPLTCMWLPYY